MENNDVFLTLRKETVYKNKWSSITKTLLKTKGLEKEIFTTNFGRRSAVILFSENKVLLTKQYRLRCIVALLVGCQRIERALLA